ncbi:hypothetical protein [uncultured Duncaniella sp.]|uniref:hypothetical protein n=1 Tax=uncultured Duncaniella sp. TaxID=2768039 RepID=UPI0025A99BD3|nr:hypothetical protein [uncultured Duncaniella sp.]
MSTASDCITADLYESLRHCPGQTSLPGIRPRALGIPKSHILSFPKLPSIDDKDADMESIATYDGDFLLEADKKFLFMDLLSSASSVKSESQGEGASKSYLNTATLFHPSVGPAVTGFSRLVLNDDFVWLVQQRDGRWRVIGNEMIETETKPAQDSGQSVTDSSGTTFTATVSDVSPAPFYVGKIRTEKGIYDCKTNTLEAVDNA